jgi:hypothetical protein
VLDNAFAVCLDAEGKVSSQRAHLRPLLPHSSSSSRFAGASAFFIYSQSGEQPADDSRGCRAPKRIRRMDRIVDIPARVCR